ncbi:MAG: YfiR family protein [Nitrospirales bacterium]
MALLTVFASRWAKGGLKTLSAAWFVISALLLSGTLQAAAPTEYQLKAVFLFNFAQFVDWPQESFPEAQMPLVIGVLGEDPFGTYLEEIVSGETVNNRRLEIQRYRRVDEMKTCHILFISQSESKRLEQIVATLKGRSILTVSDSDGFTRYGGMIRFVTEKNKLRLRINLEAAIAANLTISSKLLRPAEIVTPGKD